MIPVELTSDPKWVCWRLETVPHSGRLTKIPYSPKTGYRASSTDPRSWSDYETAVKAQGRLRASGLAYVIQKGLVGIDMDGCRDRQTGQLSAFAEDVIQKLNTYTEISQSGTGVHLIAKAKLPEFGRKRADFEIYDHRCWVVTGNHLVGTPTTIEDRQAEVEALHKRMFPQVYRAVPPAPERHLRMGVPDQEVLRRCMTMPKFQQLYRGDLTGYLNGRGEPDQSAAELAFANLCKLMTSDRAQIDRLYRQSGLYRAKWDAIHFAGGVTYGQRTIDVALGMQGRGR